MSQDKFQYRFPRHVNDKSRVVGVPTTQFIISFACIFFGILVGPPEYYLAAWIGIILAIRHIEKKYPKGIFIAILWQYNLAFFIKPTVHFPPSGKKEYFS